MQSRRARVQFSLHHNGGHTLCAGTHLGDKRGQEDRFFWSFPKAATGEEMAQLLLRSFRRAAFACLAQDGGTTATVAALTPDNRLTIAHVGDSPVMLFSLDEQNKVCGRDLIRPHKPDDIEEQATIEAMGSFVARGRIQGFLETSRSFGDVHYVGRRPCPDLSVFDLRALVPLGAKAFLCVASDGLVQRKDVNCAAAYAQHVFAAGLRRAPHVFYAMMSSALEHEPSDNLTAIVLEIPRASPRAIALGVCDGHDGAHMAVRVCHILQRELNAQPS